MRECAHLPFLQLLLYLPKLIKLLVWVTKGTSQFGAMVHHTGNFRFLQEVVVPNNKTISNPHAMNCVMSFIKKTTTTKKNCLEACFKEILEAAAKYFVRSHL